MCEGRPFKVSLICIWFFSEYGIKICLPSSKQASVCKIKICIEPMLKEQIRLQECVPALFYVVFAELLPKVGSLLPVLKLLSAKRINLKMVIQKLL